MPKPTKLRRFVYAYLKNTETFDGLGIDEIARVIGGSVSHVLGTASHVTLNCKVLGNIAILPFILIATTVSTDIFVLNPINPSTDYAEEDTSDSNKVWFDNRAYVQFSGAATARCALLIEIVKIDPYTGMPPT